MVVSFLEILPNSIRRSRRWRAWTGHSGRSGWSARSLGVPPCFVWSTFRVGITPRTPLHEGSVCGTIIDTESDTARQSASEPRKGNVMGDHASSGYWVRRRRKALDLTQDALAQQVACSVMTIRKIESDIRRPSRQIAERLAECLEIPAHERQLFIKAARAELAVDRLPRPPELPAHAPILGTPTAPEQAGASVAE